MAHVPLRPTLVAFHGPDSFSAVDADPGGATLGEPMHPMVSTPSQADAAAAFGREASPGVLFTNGPVMLDEETLEGGSEQMVYHRTGDYCARVLRCEEGLKAACGAESGARAIMLTASGTAAMEAALINLFEANDRLIVVNSGDCGNRFVEICRLHGIVVREVRLEPGRALREEDLARADSAGCAGLVLNHHETSTGSLHDLELAGRFCRGRGLLLVVDAIGSFLADPVRQAACGIDALIVSSQNGLALPPGMSFVIVSRLAAERARHVPSRSYYFNFARYLAEGLRGQTPFTPAVGIIRQLESRLKRVLARGVDRIVADTAALASDFRSRINGLPFRVLPERPSNAVTALQPLDGRDALHYVRRLAEGHRLFVGASPGALQQRIFRVSHLGDLRTDHNAHLARALAEISVSALRRAFPSK
jgi:aspartate aminotransferase-like enzyme